MNDTLPPGARARWSRGRVLRTALVVVALALCVVFLAPRAGEIVASFGRQDAGTVFGALLLGALATYATFLSWRALLAGAGHRLPLAAGHRLFFVSQIGKYVPGSIWPIVAQADLGRRHGVPASRSVTVGLLTLLVSCAAGVCTAAATLPFVLSSALQQYWFVVLFIPVVLVALHPAVLRFALRTASKLLRRDLAEVAIPLWAVVRAFLLAVVAWVLFGLHVAVLGSALVETSPGQVVLATGAYALAWLVGFAIFFLPAGLGGREAVLTTVLAAGSALDLEAAVSMALASRVLLSVVDVAAFGATSLIGRRQRAALEVHDDERTAR
jgi:uncharacterized membrane protein YbhN (UPF0104 family)